MSVWQKKNHSMQWIADHGRQLAEAGVVRGRAWTLAELCEHLALAMELTIEGPGADAPPRSWRTLSWFERAKRCCIKNIMLATGWFPQGITAPGTVTPQGTMPLPEALNRLAVATAEFDRKCAAPNATWGYHSILGRMSARAWHRFHTVHARHHFRFFHLPSK